MGKTKNISDHKAELVKTIKSLEDKVLKLEQENDELAKELDELQEDFNKKETELGESEDTLAVVTSELEELQYLRMFSDIIDQEGISMPKSISIMQQLKLRDSFKTILTP
jgi:uncharacterized protein YoxC